MKYHNYFQTKLCILHGKFGVCRPAVHAARWAAGRWVCGEDGRAMWMAAPGKADRACRGWRVRLSAQPDVQITEFHGREGLLRLEADRRAA